MLVQVLRNGQFTLPADVRRQFGLGEGDFLSLEVREDGIHLKPKRLIDASQAWFWTVEHQQKEREAEEEIAAGKVVYFNSVDALMKSLDGDE